MISSSLRASSERAWISPPAASISLTSGSSLAPLRRPAKTVNPSEANFLAISPPIKSPAPMTATVAFLFCMGLLRLLGELSLIASGVIRVAQRLRQFVFQNLAGRGRRQRVQHDDFGRALVGGELRRDMGHQVLRGGARALQQLHEGHHLFIALDRAADHRALHDGIVGGEHRLDLGRIDVEAGADDHLLGAADDVETIALEAREIAGIEPAVGIDRFGGEVGRAVIAAHHVGPADMQFADLAVCDDRCRRDRRFWLQGPAEACRPLDPCAALPDGRRKFRASIR